MSQTITIDINNRPIQIEIGKIGRQADGSALVRAGETIMFLAATSKKEIKEPKPFLPLIVDYRENTYAAGKIPGGFFKREGRPSEREILISRLIDRTIRPLFPEGFTFDTQIVALLLSADLVNDNDTLGIIGASAALYFSEIPFFTPLGAVKVGLVDGQFILSPTAEEQDRSTMTMIVAGTEEGINMIEAGALEADEEKVLEGLALAEEAIRKIIRAQKEAFAQAGIVKRAFQAKTVDPARKEELSPRIAADLLQAVEIPRKKESEAAARKILDDLLAEIPEDQEELISETKEIFHQVHKKIVRDHILERGRRVDGRALDEIRPIQIEVGLLPRTHGSALFTRGETQCLATVTLGTFEDVQRLDTLREDDLHKRFMLHYNFPPFSVGEVAFLRGPGRREVGHGALAEKSILPSIPTEDIFPYTIRIVSDILESNGSSSMATVCGGVLALMDAGVPLSMTVAGIAMGLVKEGDRFRVLTDIAGLEDHFGDMDFKISGTNKGITAIQLDLKISHLTPEILRQAVFQAREARLRVLDTMNEAISAPRPQISPYAPQILTLVVNTEKVGEIIGPGGKIIKRIQAQTKSKIDVDENGKITIAAVDKEGAERAREMIREITIEAEVGKIYEGKIVRLEEYGAFVEILPSIVGLLHISEVAPQRIRSIHDHLKLGQMIRVKVLNVGEDHKIKLSKRVLEEGGDAAPDTEPPKEGGQAPRSFPRRPFHKDRPKKRGFF
ncbi:MAG: polyribonucleotide nucleotidyltransferase [Candidatus Aminicenantes bacterium]|nr:polyribonucleotide nucleotidyltransferase [Candidatus Aminicenantes bacterium]